MKTRYLAACLLSSCLLAAPSALAAPTKDPTPPTTQTKFNPDEQTRINIYQKASPAVVTIENGRGSGSGSIIQAEGLVLTNAHVIEGARQGRVMVLTQEEKRYPGQTIAIDRENDLALVQLITDDRFPTISLASQDGIQVGQEVYAIGSPFGLSGTFTTGILSRIAPNGDLQTDAAINQGNSGGPLLNSRGELIGVNKAILSPDRRGGNIGIGFATGAEDVRRFLARSQENIKTARNAIANIDPSSIMRSQPQPRTSRNNPPQLGIAIAPNLQIIGVKRGSPAARLGLRPGDRIVAINRRRLRHIGDLLSFLNSNPDSAYITFARNRRLATVEVNF